MLILLPGAIPPPTKAPPCLMGCYLLCFVYILGGPVSQRANGHVTRARPIRFPPEILVQDRQV